MLEVVKLSVTRLQRVKVGGLALDALKTGFWRVLQPADLRALLGNDWEQTSSAPIGDGEEEHE
jgi:16S rRNA U516 pseudouridylate synthase RsuA-like enzyme